MTYFQLLLDLMERDEFLYAWITSEFFFENLEVILEMHMPSQTDWDTYLSPAFHEYLPGSLNHAGKFLKHYQRTQAGLKFTQTYWIKLTGILMQRRKLAITTNDFKRAPFDRYVDFLHYMACKNSKINQEDHHGGQQDFHPGLNNSFMITNLFANSAYLLDQTLLQEPVQCFPFHCLFMRDGYDFDDSLLKMDRIGGSFTHLENELSDHLKPFKGQ